LTQKRQKNLPKLQNKNELPTHNLAEEEAKFAKDEEIVLSPEDQEKLDYYQTKFHVRIFILFSNYRNPYFVFVCRSHTLSIEVMRRRRTM
jgi:hypothetical protein